MTVPSCSRLFSCLMVVGLAACGGADAPATSDGTATRPTSEAPAAEPASSGDVDGEAIYTNVCVVCHQVDGSGMTGAFPPLDGSTWVTGSADVAIKILIHGMTGPVEVNGVTYNGVMLPYGNAVPMSDEEVAAVLTYTRQSWSNSADPITAEEVARVRAETSDRTTPYTAAELADER